MCIRDRGGSDNVWFRADCKTVHAVGASSPFVGADPYDWGLAKYSVAGAHRAKMAAPAALGHKNIEDKDCRNENSGRTHAEKQATYEGRDRVDVFPGESACDPG